MQLSRLFGFYGLVLLFLACTTLDAGVMQLDSGRQGHWADGYMEVLHDPEGTLDFEAAMQGVYEPLSDKASFGFTNETLWLRLQVRPNDASHRWLLEVALSSLDDIRLFAPQSDGSYKEQHAGDHYVFSERPIRHRLFIFPLTLSTQHANTIYLRVKTADSFVVPIRFWTQEQFEHRQENEYLLLGFSYGVMAAMFIYNIFLWLVLRDRLYGYYLLSTLGLILVSADEYLWPNNLWLADNQHVLIPAFHFTVLSLWVRAFLQTKQRHPYLDRGLLGVIAGAGVMLTVDLLGFYTLGNELAFIVGLSMIAIVITISVRSVLSGYAPARIFLLAQIFPLFGAILTLLRAIGVVGDSLIAEHALQFGTTVEVLLFSFALAQRIQLLKKEKQQAKAEAETDYLTGLLNRAGFINRVNKQLAGEGGEPFALLLIDLDKFKPVNDTLGHAAGDEVLSEVARRLRTQVRSGSDSVCRFGGDEFIVHLQGVAGGNAAGQVAKKIIDTLNRPIETAAGSAHIGASIGVALFPKNGSTLETLLHHADQSMYHVKNSGANSWYTAV